MGWSANPAERAALLPPGTIQPKDQHMLPSASACTHCVIDGPAIFRNLATHPTSAERIVKTFIDRHIPKSVKHVYYSDDHPARMMPQRAELHAKRYAGNAQYAKASDSAPDSGGAAAPAPKSTDEIEFKAGITADFSWTVNYGRRRIDYGGMFKTPRGKAIAMELLGRALWLALIKSERFTSISVDLRSGMLAVGTHPVGPLVAAACNYGEADQRIFTALACWKEQHGPEARTRSLILTVDSDTILQSVGNPAAPPATYIRLKNEVISGPDLVTPFAASIDHRLSATARLARLGSDYSITWSKLGYPRKALASLSLAHTVPHLTLIDDGAVATLKLPDPAAAGVPMLSAGRGFYVANDWSLVARVHPTTAVLAVFRVGFAHTAPLEGCSIIIDQTAPPRRQVAVWPAALERELATMKKAKKKKPPTEQERIAHIWDTLWTAVYFAGLSPNNPDYGGPPRFQVPPTRIYNLFRKRNFPFVLHREIVPL